MTISYDIYKSNSDFLITVVDGEIDNTASSITLIGKNYTGYGNVQNQNFVHIVENFASNTAPTSPLVGQVWWDTSENYLKVYTNGVWKVLSQSAFQPIAPTDPQDGDVWFDTTNQQFNVFNGTTWIVVGPDYTQTQGVSGVLPESVWDTEAPPALHTILRVMSGGDVYGIFSKDSSFTLSANSAIAGFTTLDPGLTLVDPGTIPNIKLNGYATLDSPLFVGTPMAPSTGNTDNSDRLATTMFVSNLFTNIRDGVVANLDTLNELATAINNDANFGNNISSNISRIDNTVTIFVSNVNSRFTAGNVTLSNHTSWLTSLSSNIVSIDNSIININNDLTNYALQSNVNSLATYVYNNHETRIDTTETNITNHDGRITILEGNGVDYNARITSLEVTMPTKATIQSPTFSGEPRAPTVNILENGSTKLATTEYVKQSIGAITGWAPTISTNPPTGGSNGDVWFQI